MSGAPRSHTSRDRTSITLPERVDVDHEILFGPFVGDRQAFELLSVGAPVDTKSYDYTWLAPVGVLRRGWPVATRLIWRLRGSCRRLPTQTVRTPKTHHMIVPAKKDRDLPVAITRILRCKLRHSRQHRHILRSLPRSIM